MISIPFVGETNQSKKWINDSELDPGRAILKKKFAFLLSPWNVIRDFSTSLSFPSTPGKTHRNRACQHHELRLLWQTIREQSLCCLPAPMPWPWGGVSRLRCYLYSRVRAASPRSDGGVEVRYGSWKPPWQSLIFFYSEAKYSFLWVSASFSPHDTLLELSLTISHYILPTRRSLIQVRPVIFSLPGVWKLTGDPQGLKTLGQRHPLSALSEISCEPLLPSHPQACLFLWAFLLILWAP